MNTPRVSQKNKKTELIFEPITDGLGFHPFSDGLPYAPVSKTPTKNLSSRGAGATAAGPAQFVRPQNSSPKVSVPVASVSTTASTTLNKATPVSIEALPETTLGIGYILKRSFAYAFDTVLHLGLCSSALFAALSWQKIPLDSVLNPNLMIWVALFLGFFHWAITLAQEITFGTTVGKHLVGLRIEGSAAALFLRAFFFMPSVCFGGLGLMWGLFGRQKRCWHDWVVDVQPLPLSTNPDRKST